MPTRRRRAILVPVVALLVAITAPSVQAADCRFVLGFAALRAAVGSAIVGDCLEDEHHGANGDALQHTTGGLLVWRKADNYTAFTDGYRTWVMGPFGLQRRLNTERFPWEAPADSGGGTMTEQQIGALARETAARVLSVSVDTVTVERIEPVEWGDTSLGCPELGMAYAQVITPGYRVTVRVDDKLHEVHTDDGDRAVFCRQSSV